jgi:hypothetical protein
MASLVPCCRLFLSLVWQISPDILEPNPMARFTMIYDCGFPRQRRRCRASSFNLVRMAGSHTCSRTHMTTYRPFKSLNTSFTDRNMRELFLVSMWKITLLNFTNYSLISFYVNCGKSNRPTQSVSILCWCFTCRLRSPVKVCCVVTVQSEPKPVP